MGVQGLPPWVAYHPLHHHYFTHLKCQRVTVINGLRINTTGSSISVLRDREFTALAGLLSLAAKSTTVTATLYADLVEKTGILRRGLALYPLRSSVNPVFVRTPN